MRGRIPPDEDAWLYRKWKTEVDMDSLLQATLPRGPVEDEVDSYEVFVLAGRVSELSNAATPEQDAVVPVLATPSNVAKPLIAGISEEEDTAIPVAPTRMATHRTPVDETKPLVVGDWLSDKDIVAWLNDTLQEVGKHTLVDQIRLCVRCLRLCTRIRVPRTSVTDVLHKQLFRLSNKSFVVHQPTLCALWVRLGHLKKLPTDEHVWTGIITCGGVRRGSGLEGP